MPITTQPSAGKPAGSSGEFQNSLFGCSCGSCLKSLFCPCLIAKDVANEVGDSGTLWCFAYLAGIFGGYLVSLFCFFAITNLKNSQCTFVFATNVAFSVRIVALMAAVAVIWSSHISVLVASWPKWTAKSTKIKPNGLLLAHDNKITETHARTNISKPHKAKINLPTRFPFVLTLDCISIQNNKTRTLFKCSCLFSYG